MSAADCMTSLTEDGRVSGESLDFKTLLKQFNSSSDHVTNNSSHVTRPADIGGRHIADKPLTTYTVVDNRKLVTCSQLTPDTVKSHVTVTSCSAATVRCRTKPMTSAVRGKLERSGRAIDTSPLDSMESLEQTGPQQALCDGVNGTTDQDCRLQQTTSQHTVTAAETLIAATEHTVIDTSVETSAAEQCPGVDSQCSCRTTTTTVTLCTLCTQQQLDTSQDINNNCRKLSTTTTTTFIPAAVVVVADDDDIQNEVDGRGLFTRDIVQATVPGCDIDSSLVMDADVLIPTSNVYSDVIIRRDDVTQSKPETAVRLTMYPIDELTVDDTVCSSDVTSDVVATDVTISRSSEHVSTNQLRVTCARHDVTNNDVVECSSPAVDDVFLVETPAVTSSEPAMTSLSCDVHDEDEESDDEVVFDQSQRVSQWKYVGDTPTTNSTSDVTLLLSSASSESTTPLTTPTVSNFSNKQDNITADTPRRCDKQRSSSLDVFNRVKSTRTIRRSDTMMTYQTVSNRESVTERTLTLEKKDCEASFGFHLIGVGPMIVSTVEPGSAADVAGVLVGDKLISVNDVSVITETQSAITQLISDSSSSLTLTVAGGILSRDLPVHAGNVQHLDDRKLIKNWQRRWVEVKHDGFLYFYKKQEDTSPLSALCLSGHVIVKAPETGRDFVFKLVKYGAKVYSQYFQCLSADDMIRWVSSINSVKAHKTIRPGMWLDISSHNVGVPAMSIKDPECHGFLLKVGNHYRTWRRRYCVLKYACLYYYRDPSSSTAKGVAHLHGYTVNDDSSRKFGFQLVPPLINMRLFQFVAENETDKKRWMLAMKSSIEKWIPVSNSI